ncbi:hypothetical protein DSM104440_03226 [Usitatibacter palustris]|uniref:Uncharacterized protein n=2 Tax=Usitatibacter palustris TaxID=2732487 RepID=A0A6M4HB13_9PROT|nr:hypothetical protein DSM104440_03226 [Usitatibacter palustris]
MLIGIAVAVVVVIALGGGYVWYQMQALSPRIQPVAAARPVAAPVVPPTPIPFPPEAPTAAPAGPGPAPPLAMLKPETAPIEAAKTRPAPQAAEQLVMDLLREAPAAGTTPPLKLSRSIDAPRVAPEVAAGYDALKRGDMGAAKTSYQAALTNDSRNLDALLGMATVEARSGSRDAAQRLYRRALEIDPRNTVALAGLAALADFSRPAPLEAQLKADLARAPQSAALQFTLGNVYASQSRWNDAQAAFFEAHRLEPGNADFAHNLAVSLDHLGQARLATEYYGKALALAPGQRVNFDTQAVARRISELKS